MAGKLLQLFLSFLKIGFTSFGGLSMVPLVNSEMINHGFMTANEVMDIVAIAEMTPGPLGLNCATFAGLRAAGILGAVVSVIGVLTPSFTLAYVVGVFFEKFRKSRAVSSMMNGVRPSAIGMILGVMVSLSLSNYVGETGDISYVSILLSLLDVFLLVKLKMSIPKVIGINAVLGIILFGFLGLS